MAEFSDYNDGNTEGANVNIADSVTPTNKAKVTLNQDLRSADILIGPGVEGALTVGTTAVEVKVGGSPLTTRKLVTVYNNSNSTIYWGYTSGVTTTTGTPIFKNQTGRWDISAETNAKIYLIAGSAGNNTRITESA